jgi:hypothetical protein
VAKLKERRSSEIHTELSKKLTREGIPLIGGKSTGLKNQSVANYHC